MVGSLEKNTSCIAALTIQKGENMMRSPSATTEEAIAIYSII
ncbi:hypothetical protein [Scytonema millei]|nr:hypothetical protein [Scytonema millei]